MDKLDAVVQKELKELDNSVLWSRKYTKQDFKQGFFYPAILFLVLIWGLVSYGVRYRMYMQHIRFDRKLDFADRLDIDLDDVSSYPKAVYEEYLEKQK